jgi:hypothetical protein
VRDDAVLRRLSATMCDSPPDALRRVELVSRRVNASLGGWDWRPALAAVQAPVLVVQAPGAVTWLAGAREWVANLADAKLVVMGSVPQFPWLYSERRFADVARRFLDGAWPAGARVAGDTLP